MVPGEFADPIQIIDARDLGEFAVHLSERSVPGIFNASAPPYPLGNMLEELPVENGSVILEMRKHEIANIDLIY